MLSCASCWFFADLQRFRQQLYSCLSPAHLWEPSVGPPAQPQSWNQPPTPNPAPHPCHCCTLRAELMGSPFPAASQNQQASRPPKRNVFRRYIRHSDANSARTDENMTLEGGNVGMQPGQPVMGCPGWAHVEQRHRSGLPGGRGVHKGRVCREGQSQS